VEYGTQSYHCDNKLNTEVRNVECGTQADHHTCTVNDILFAIQRFQIWLRRESHLTCAVHLRSIPRVLDVTQSQCSSDVTQKPTIFICNSSVNTAELCTEIKQTDGNSTVPTGCLSVSHTAHFLNLSVKLAAHFNSSPSLSHSRLAVSKPMYCYAPLAPRHGQFPTDFPRRNVIPDIDHAFT